MEGLEGLVPHNTVCPVTAHKIGDSNYTYETCDVGWHREWMSPDKRVAVGLNDDGTVDEVLTFDAPIHIEQMNYDNYWMIVDNRYVFHFSYGKGRTVNLNYSYDNES